MKLTPKEQEICGSYGKPDKFGFVHCHECPMNICDDYYKGLECYATIGERTAETMKLKRWG